jgi:GT2 family glycosyltransferase
VLSAARLFADRAEVVVVDDASTDGGAGYVENRFPHVRVLRLHRNAGFARACDHGIRAARGRIVVLLNTDVRVREDFIAPLVAHFDRDNVFAVMSLSLREDGVTVRESVKVPFFKRGFIKFMELARQEPPRALAEGNGRPMHSFYAVGGHSAIDRSKYLRLGGFDDLYYPFYWEEVDLCYRAWKQGWETIFEPRSVVYHSSSGAIHTEFEQEYRANIIRRNRFLFIWKNIESKRLLCFRHLMPLLLRCTGGIFVFDWDFYRALFSALAKLPNARERRRREKMRPRRLSDEEIFLRAGRPLEERH